MRRILVVDDDLHVGQAVSVWLKARDIRFHDVRFHGLRVSTADGDATGLAALGSATFLIAISGYAFSGTESTSSQFLRLVDSLSELQQGLRVSDPGMEAPREPGRFGGRSS